MVNPRTRGKIPHVEWPKIAQRFSTGESLTAIARDYQCTAPAIRYIIQRVSSANRAAGAEPEAERHPPARVPRLSKLEEPYSLRHQFRVETPVASAIWSRVNSDIANFLVAVDALFAADTDQNRSALLGATDRLLRASARTRMELERMFGAKLPSSHGTAPASKSRKIG